MTTVTDDFNRANGAIGGTWGGADSSAFTIVSNRLDVAGAVGNAVTNGTALATVDHEAEVDVISAASASGFYPAVCVRCATANENNGSQTCYLVYTSLTGNDWGIVQRVAGSFNILISGTTLSQGTLSGTFNSRLRVTTVGLNPVLTWFVNDIQEATTTDSSGTKLTGGLYTGIRGYDNGVVDNFVAADVVTAGASPQSNRPTWRSAMGLR